MANIDLQVVISAVDEASAKLASIQKSAGTLGKEFGVVGGVMAGALALAVKSASDAQVSTAKLDATLNSMGQAGKDARAQIIKLGDSALKLGFDNEEASLSMAMLFQRTGDMEEAWEMQQIAMDLARAKSIDLAEASKVVGMVMSGNGKILKQYGIDVQEISDPHEQLQQLMNKVGGQSQAFADTFAGSSEILKQQVGELTEKIGAQLLPILTSAFGTIAPLIEKLGAWADAHPELVKNIVLATGAIAGLLLVLAPILLVVSAISAPMLIAGAVIGVLAYAVYELVANWERIAPVIAPTLETMKQLALVVGDFLKPAFDFLIVALGLLWTQLKVLWDILEPVLIPVLKVLGILVGATLVAGIAILVASVGLIAFAIAGFIKGLDMLIEKLGALFYWFQVKVPEGLAGLTAIWTSTWDGIKNVTTSVTDYIQGKIQKIIDLWNSAKDIAGSVGGSLKSASKAVSNAVGSLAGKAGGGSVVAGNSYIVGEKGQEVFTPSTSGSIIPNNRLGGGGGITVNINGGTYLSEDVAKQIGDKIISQFRRTVRI